MQQRIKSIGEVDEKGVEEPNEMPDMPSSIPFLPHVVSISQFHKEAFDFGYFVQQENKGIWILH